ncbi:MAG TPA: UDP-glucose 4-epimerase GalE [Mycobacteriales bacterium]|jgi:UDP-glucose 4-epimerase|nr:UDP-glucose 4-epimerase GalE [Mycobacteriales bacterium]
MANWLVTGGAGYIGAHVVAALADKGEQAVVIDDLSTGEPGRATGSVFVEGSILDEDLVRRTLRDHDVLGIIHIAAKKQVGESVADPQLYYEQNVVGTLRLLNAAVAEKVPSFVFSSSAAVYGMPDVEIVTEEMAGRPMSPYGTSKLIGEWSSRDVAVATGLRVVSLRYFNVAGAARPELGDPGVFNLIPLAFQAIDAGQQPRIFGADYPTRDGTCVRDYVHVADIAEAHVAALRDLAEGGGESGSFRVFNVGRGEGSSVREVLDLVAEVTGHDLDPTVADRRPGDPARYVANVDRIRDELGWSASYDLQQMVSSAWEAWQHRRSSR